LIEARERKGVVALTEPHLVRAQALGLATAATEGRTAATVRARMADFIGGSCLAEPRVPCL
jgi:hypothetical protein